MTREAMNPKCYNIHVDLNKVGMYNIYSGVERRRKTNDSRFEPEKSIRISIVP